MIPAARIAAAIEVLDLILSGSPAEKALTHWGRAHRFAGSGDRLAIRDHVYAALRCRRSLAALGGGETGRGLMIGMVRRDGPDPALLFTGVGHAPGPITAQESAITDLPDPVRLDLPDWLHPLFVASLGAQCEAVLRVLQTRAPVFLRVNLRRVTVAEAVTALARDGVIAVPHVDVKTALHVTENARKIHQSQAYLTGLVELQDAASQAAVLRLPQRAGQRVLDYCAGGGGKALALVAVADVAVTAHDIVTGRMVDLPLRAARAGVRIDRVTTADLAVSPPFDLVLVDAPCSGSGTWRRTPDAKWRLTPPDLARLTMLQAAILRQAAPLVAPGGTLAYCTCSVLHAENRAQVDAFTANHPFQVQDEMQLLPSDRGDGFYLAVLQRAGKQPSVAIQP